MVNKYLTSFDRCKIYYRISKADSKSIGDRKSTNNRKSRTNPKKLFLVFLHGWPHNHTVWNKELRFFEKLGYSTIAVDLRGHGKSDKPERLEDYSFDKFAKDINLIIKKEKISKFALIGHSFGGMIALSYYSLYPANIKSLVLLDTIYENPLKHATFLKYFKLTTFTEGLLKFILSNEKIQKTHFAYVNFSKFKDHSDFYYWIKGAETTPIKSVLSCMEQMIRFDRTDVLRKINIPTLILEGEKDTKTSLNDVKAMAKMIKTSTLRVIPGATHDTNIRNTCIVESEISTFLDGIN
ncbi:TPA: alpha/beta hydrolase [Candidatus Woesearchaeota archaeon]|nr:alpha/beta hydrolase [Candidatus Woesearchaeota archaeon]